MSGVLADRVVVHLAVTPANNRSWFSTMVPPKTDRVAFFCKHPLLNATESDSVQNINECNDALIGSWRGLYMFMASNNKIG
jgi:hypothetical protein